MIIEAMSAPEHNFEEQVLVSGEEIRSYTAASDLSLREPVGISGDNEVDASSANGNFVGVVLYDVASGEEAPVAGDDCEVNIEVSETVAAGDELLPDGNGTFETVATSSGSTGVAVANEGGGNGDVIEAYIFSNEGAEA